MSHVVSLRLQEEQLDALRRVARCMGRTTSEAAAMLLEEALRQQRFAFVQFRDSPAGRQAYIQGTRVAVWQVVWLVRECQGDEQRVARHLGLPLIQVKAALNYADAFAEEIEAAIEHNAIDAETIRRLVPALEVLAIDVQSGGDVAVA